MDRSVGDAVTWIVGVTVGFGVPVGLGLGVQANTVP